MLATVRQAQTFGDHEECVRRLIARHGLAWAGSVGSQLVQQRNTAVANFLATDLEWLFLVDSDMTFSPMALDWLLDVADPSSAPIVGGITVSYDPRSRAVMPTMYRRGVDGDLHPVVEWQPGEVVEVDATGAACVVVHRSVFEAVAAEGFSVEFPWFDLGRTGRLGGTGEDLEFFRRVRSLGIPIHVHTGVPFGHLKVVEISIADFVAQLTSTQETT